MKRIPAAIAILALPSLYRRRVDASHGELWFKVGPAATDWQRIAP